jgi:hypothetical protein
MANNKPTKKQIESVKKLKEEKVLNQSKINK